MQYFGHKFKKKLTLNNTANVQCVYLKNSESNGNNFQARNVRKYVFYKKVHMAEVSKIDSLAANLESSGF